MPDPGPEHDEQTAAAAEQAAERLVDAAAEGPAAPAQQARWGRRLLTALVLAVTLAALGWQVGGAWHELTTRTWSIRYDLLAASAAVYGVGLAMMSAPWLCAARGAAPRARLGPLVAAYVVSHVGKYIPGKAMAVVIRAGMASSNGVAAADTVACTFFETFLTMAVGAASGAAAFGWQAGPAGLARLLTADGWMLKASGAEAADRIWAIACLGCAGLAAGFFVASLPPVFRRLQALATGPFKKLATVQPLNVSAAGYAVAAALSLASWCVQGLAYVLVAANVSHGWPSPGGVFVLLGAWGSSVAIGFVTMLPGQAFVREAVLAESIRLLTGDQAAGLASSVLFRFVTLIVEIGLAGFLWSTRRTTSSLRP